MIIDIPKYIIITQTLDCKLDFNIHYLNKDAHKIEFCI